jgi:hypothetical protein
LPTIGLHRAADDGAGAHQSFIQPLPGHRRSAGEKKRQDKKCVSFYDLHMRHNDQIWPNLYSAHQQENDDDEQDKTYSAAGDIAPTGAVRPCRQRADQKQHQQDEQDCAKHERNSSMDDWRGGLERLRRRRAKFVRMAIKFDAACRVIVKASLSFARGVRVSQGVFAAPPGSAVAIF